MGKTCVQCKADIEAWNEKCGGCGYTLVLEPDAVLQERRLRAPALGALLFTQGWCFGARMYGWFLLSLIPMVGIIVLPIMVLFGRRWAWKAGGWTDWQEFEDRMRLLDVLSAIWIVLLIGGWSLLRLRG